MPGPSGRSKAGSSGTATAAATTAGGPSKKKRKSLTTDTRLLESDRDSGSDEGLERQQQHRQPQPAVRKTGSKAAGNSKAPAPSKASSSKASTNAQVSPGSRRSTRLSGEGVHSGGSDNDQPRARPPKKAAQLVPSKRKQPPSAGPQPGATQPTPPLTDAEDEGDQQSHTVRQSQAEKRGAKAAAASSGGLAKKAKADDSQRASPNRKAAVSQMSSLTGALTR